MKAKPIVLFGVIDYADPERGGNMPDPFEELELLLTEVAGDRRRVKRWEGRRVRVTFERVER